jgi:hypothetical protein
MVVELLLSNKEPLVLEEVEDLEEEEVDELFDRMSECRLSLRVLAMWQACRALRKEQGEGDNMASGHLSGLFVPHDDIRDRDKEAVNWAYEDA